MMGKIRCIETYRGVGIHDCQPRQRIETRVKPEIDFIYDLDDVAILMDYAGNCGNPPEARMLAGAKLMAMWHIAGIERRVRPNVDLDRVQAVIAGLDSEAWRSPTHYGTLMCHGGGDQAEPREVPLSTPKTVRRQ